MQITVAYVISQILAVAEYALLGASYLAKKRRNVVVLDIASMSCGIVAFFLLGADLGMAMSIIILLANFYYLWEESFEKKGRVTKAMKQQEQVWRNIVLAIVLLGIGVVTILTYDGPLSLLSVAATVIYEISIWQKSTKMYKFLGIPVAICWMAYNGFVLSIFGAICELGMLVAAIVGYTREVKAGKRIAKKR